VYHVLAGQPPHDGRSVYEVMRKKSGAPPRLQPPVSEETADLVAAMMAQNPDDRPATYADLLARIDALPCLDGGFSYSGLAPVSVRAPVVLAPPQESGTAPTPAPVPVPATRRPWWVYAVAVVGLLGAGVGIAALTGAFNRTPVGMTNPPHPDKPVTYTAVSAHPLFDGEVFGWTGPGLSIEKDDEQKPVLAFHTTVARGLKDRPNFRVVLALDCYKATTAEVVIATSDSLRWLVRLDAKDGVAFGKQAKGGAFEPVGTPIPFPAPKPNQPPYLELQYERAGGTLAASFDRQPLGRAPAEGAKSTELRINAIGGPVRIESAEYIELVEAKE
jgi:hypothetical protein